jgi:glycosyltransferase involved in cell wall biosynthesis
MSKFSVIIATYNRAKYITATLESLKAQEFKDYEVIVVDDGSTDNTPKVLESYAQRIRFYRQENAGPGAARNLGVSHANGEYVAFLDSDDLWFPWTLEIYAEIVRSERKPAFIAGKPFRFDDERMLSQVNAEPLQTRAFADYLASGDEWRWWGVSSFVVQRNAFESVGGFANQWINGEDADLALRLGVKRGFVQISEPFTFGYREHAASEMKNLNRTLAGAKYKVRLEQTDGYPGGRKRARERWRILTRHIRPVSLNCLRQGRRREAWELYRATLPWHISLGRWKFLIGFPLRACLPGR